MSQRRSKLGCRWETSSHLQCQLCGRWLQAITYSHLKYVHGIPIPARYKVRFKVDKITAMDVRRQVADSKRIVLRRESEYIKATWGRCPLDTLSIKLRLNPSTIRTHAKRLGLPPLRRSWNRKSVLAELRRAYRLGRPLHSGAARRSSPQLYGAAHHHFGSWRKAVEAMGLRYLRIARRAPFERWSTRRILREIRHLITIGGHESYRFLERHHPKLYAAARNYFGSWKAAVRSTRRA